MTAKYGSIEFANPSDSGGFFSNYFSVISTMKDCAINGLIPHVDSTNTWFNPTCDFENNTVSDPSINPWDWWFVQSTKEESTPFVKMGLNRYHIPHIPMHFMALPNMPEFKSIANQYCPIKSHILEEEELLYKQHIEGKNTLGILARGTEMLVHHLEYPKVSAKDWPEIIKLCLDQYPDIDNIFLVSDDKRIIESVVNAYPQTKYLEHFFRTTNQTEEELSDKNAPWWLHSPDNDPNHRRRLGEEALIQVRLLSRCTYFAGSHSGMFNATLFFNENPFKHVYLI
jgi:hypothetical protein